MIRNEINNSIKRGGQARQIIIDARGTGLSEEEAIRGINRAMGISRGKIECHRGNWRRIPREELMSVEMNLFFDARGGLDEVAAALGSVLGVELRPIHEGEERRYEYRGLGVELVCFQAEGFEDSVGIPFSRYSFVLDIIPIRADMPEEHWWNLMYYTAMYCFGRITSTLKWPSIIVHDLQKLEAQFGS